MDNCAWVDVIVSSENLVHEGNSFSFRDNFPIGDEFGQISSLAEFSDYVGVVLGVIDVIDFYYVLAVLQRFEHFYFGSKEILVDLAFDHFHVDDFDGYCLFWIDKGLPVRSLRPLKTWLE